MHKLIIPYKPGMEGLEMNT